jgi:hypothetical protein
VHGVTRLHVTTVSGGAMSNDEFAVTQLPAALDLLVPIRFPVTITVDALDGNDFRVGAGMSTLATDADSALVLLEPDDFVVNTNYGGDQFLTNDFEAVGLQLAADATATWTTAFRDVCSSCNVLARRFDAIGQPIADVLPISTTLTTSAAIPAVATAGSTTFVLWDFTDTVGGARGVACRAFAADGTLLAGQQSISSDAADVVAATGLSNGNAAVTWQVFPAVRMAIVKPDCTLVGAVQTVSVSTASTGTSGAMRSHIAANGSTILVSWLTDGDLWVRTGTLAGALGAEIKLVDKTATQTIEHARIAPFGTGFAIAARWAAQVTSDSGKFELYQVSSTGALSATTLVTDAVHSDFSSTKSFGVARREIDGAMLITWHDCEVGPGSCDVFGQLVHSLGMPVGSPRMIASSAASDQINPSVAALPDAFVAAWNDSSGTAPDTSGTAVRARILYFNPDEATSVLGAKCGAAQPACENGLTCAASSDGVERCFETCAGALCPHGGSCVSGACTY